MLERLNLTKSIFPTELVPQGVTESIEMPNLKVTSTVTEDLFINIGSNCPIKTLNFGTMVVDARQARLLQKLLIDLQGNQSVFWLRDPFDYTATRLPDYQKYHSFTQGIVVYHPLDTTRADYYKLYAIQTSRGYKGYLRRIYRILDTARLDIGVNEYIPTPALIETTNVVDVELNYSILGIPNTVPRHVHNRGAALSFEATIAEFTFLTPFRIISDFSITPLNTNTCDRVYQVSGLSMREVILPFHNNIKSGFRQYNSINYLSAVPNSRAAFSPATPISLETNDDFTAWYNSFLFNYDYL